MDIQNSVLVLALHLLDAIVTAAGIIFIAHFCQVNVNEHYYMMCSAIFVLALVTFSHGGVYRSWRGSRLYLECITILKAWIIMAGLLFFLLFITKTSTIFSRKVLLIWTMTTPLVIMLLHICARFILRYLRRRGYNTKNAVIVGAGQHGYDFARFITDNPWTGIRIAGYFDDRLKPRPGDSPDEKIKILGTFRDVREFLQNNIVDYIYLALPLRAQKRIEYVLSLTRTGGAQVFLVPDLFSYYMQNAEVQFMEDRMLLNFNPAHPLKRKFDIIFSSLVLVLLSPLFLFIGIMIKLEDKGPVFYRHRRITATGRDFGCLKFRTMHVNADKKLKELLAADPEAKAEWEKTFKLKNDPRITRIGRFLRKTSLDELPQFWNVLVGDMSVVGARPIISRELYEYYRDKAGIYCSIKPGVTGLWQVSGRSDIEDYNTRIAMDTQYILNRTMWLDIKIIFRTILMMFTGKGAY